MPSVIARPPPGTSRAWSAIPAPAAGADVVLLAVPDRAIAEVRAELPAGQWVGHVSGATPLAALGAPPRRFVLHPAQSMERDGGAAQLDGVSAFTTGADAAADRFAADLAGVARACMPSRSPSRCARSPTSRACSAPRYLVTLFATACRLLGRDDAGRDPRAARPPRPRERPRRRAGHAADRAGRPRRRATVARAPGRAAASATPPAATLYRALARAPPLPIVDRGARRRRAWRRLL